MLFGESFVYAFSLSLRILIHHGLHPSLLGCLVGLGEGGVLGVFLTAQMKKVIQIIHCLQREAVMPRGVSACQLGGQESTTFSSRDRECLFLTICTV